jgi:hypothetical protein
MGHSASQCPKKNKGKGKKHKQFVGIAKALVEVKYLSSKIEIDFFMVICLSTNIVSGAGWYVNNEESRHMTFN